MRKTTYAYNSVIFGGLLGLLVGASTQNIFLGIIVIVVVTIAGYYLIRFIEKSLDKGLDKAAGVAAKAYRQRKDNAVEKRQAENRPATGGQSGHSSEETEYIDEDL